MGALDFKIPKWLYLAKFLPVMRKTKNSLSVEHFKWRTDFIALSTFTPPEDTHHCRRDRNTVSVDIKYIVHPIYKQKAYW
jgi:hypothetical protein